ncbi:MAG: hypothetical protein M9951_08130 [Burkholderiaceae bacterium]|jgi:hypothetical protein|nr:hypothetical protein [Burkholderiaceae bacterium]MEB2320761.1 hypothetical protein [Pseudomonadota bacterium]
MRTNDDTLEWVDMGVMVEMLRASTLPPEASPNAAPPAPAPEPARAISPRALRLVEMLPRGFRLYETRLNYPHVVEQLAAAWHDPRRFAAVIDELTLADRPNRAGFPFPVLNELTNLRDHYFAEIHPEYRDRLRRGPV